MTIKEFITSRIAAFGHAFHGWDYVLKSQHNAWIHSVVASIVVVLGLWLGLPPRDWAVLVLAIAMVFTAEFINTSIEATVDRILPPPHPGALGRERAPRHDRASITGGEQRDEDEPNSLDEVAAHRAATHILLTLTHGRRSTSSTLRRSLGRRAD